MVTVLAVGKRINGRPVITKSIRENYILLYGSIFHKYIIGEKSYENWRAVQMQETGAGNDPG
jgi:hypothetical protein